MTETALITIIDIRAYRNVDPKLNDTRLDNFIKEVQRVNLRELLGDAMYYDYFENSDNYTDLLNGEEYTYDGDTIQYFGLKPCLVYWVLAMLAREGELFHSAHGAIELVNNPQQNFEKAKEKERIALNYMQTAERYANEVRQYLDENSSSYPLWEDNEGLSEAEFTTFKVP